MSAVATAERVPTAEELRAMLAELRAIVDTPPPAEPLFEGLEEFLLMFVTDLRAERDSLQRQLADTTLTVVEMYRIMGKVEGIKGMLRRLELFAELYHIEV